MAQAEAKLRDALGREPDNADVLDLLATRLQERGEFAEATVLYRRTLELEEKKPGTKHENTLTTVTSFGALPVQNGELNVS